jgi:GTP-binding protein
VTRPLPLRFVMSADRSDRLPDSPAEVAVVGRSNVGKSSLINALANRHRLAEVSKTPGRTRLLNCFALGEQRPDAPPAPALIDCPGYGYANVPDHVRVKWQRMIEGYLLGRPQLRMILALVDGEVGPTKLDLQLLEWLRAEDRPHTVVATKRDKVKSSKREHRRVELAERCDLGPEDVVWVSVEDGYGLDRLRGLVLGWLDARGGGRSR